MVRTMLRSLGMALQLCLRFTIEKRFESCAPFDRQIMISEQLHGTARDTGLEHAESKRHLPSHRFFITWMDNSKKSADCSRPVPVARGLHGTVRICGGQT